MPRSSLFASLWRKPHLLVGFIAVALACNQAAADSPKWETVTTTGQPTARHEASFAAVDGKLYLLGGRRINPVDIFDPETGTWSAASPTPIELHHFQAVVVDGSIFMVGAMTGGYPKEKPLEKVVVYHPAKDEFKFIHWVPPTRRRGGAGAALYEGKIYVVGGITNGHMGGFVPWLDVYNPKTGDWKPLPDAPHARDHFQAVVVKDKLYAFAGRTTSKKTGHVFDLTVEQCDVFDLKTEKWLTDEASDIPTPRAGNMAIGIDGHVIIGGGESGGQKTAHEEVEAFNCVEKSWSKVPSMNRGRHGAGFAVVDDYLYTASGSGNKGGSPELTSLERIKLTDLLPASANSTE